ncbi:hypothetical protein YC2023_091959 [Brassica napus]
MEVKVREFVPFVAMVIMEACTIALTIMAKTALTGGMSPFVFHWVSSSRVIIECFLLNLDFGSQAFPPIFSFAITVIRGPCCETPLRILSYDMDLPRHVSKIDKTACRLLSYNLTTRPKRYFSILSIVSL